MHTKDKIIRQFGITSKYKGYRYLLDAITLLPRITMNVSR